MNTQYFAILTTIFLVMGLTPVTQAQVPGAVLTSMLNDVLVQHYPKSQSQGMYLEPPLPPERGAPGGRRGGATRNANISLENRW